MQCLLFIYHSFAVTSEHEKSFQFKDAEVPLQLLSGFIRCSGCHICLAGLLQCVFPNGEESTELCIVLALRSYCRVSADL